MVRFRTPTDDVFCLDDAYSRLPPPSGIELPIDPMPTFKDIEIVEPVDTGSTRMIVRPTTGKYSDCVVKIARSSDWVEVNKKEYKTWKALRNTGYSDHLARVRGISDNGFLLIMECVEQEKVPHTVADTLQDVFSQFDEIPLDIRPANIGYRNNTPVLLDYPWHEGDGPVSTIEDQFEPTLEPAG